MGKKQKNIFIQIISEILTDWKNFFEKIILAIKSVFLGINANKKTFELVFPIFFFALATFYYFKGSHLSGHIAYSDMDFGFQKEYMFRIFPMWNFEWSTANFFNSTRIYFLAPLALVANIFDLSGSAWEKLIIFTLLWGCGYSMYLLCIKMFTEDTELGRNKTPRWFLIFAALIAGLFYAFNPWVTIRVQHIYLLVGHALLPIIFLFTIRLTEDFVFISQNTKEYNKRKLKSPIKTFAKKIFGIKHQTVKKTRHKRVILRSIIGMGFFWAASVGAIHYLFFSFFLIAGWAFYRVLRYLLQKRWRESAVIVVRFFSAGFLAMALLAFYLAPFIKSSMIGSVNPPNINSIDSTDMVSRNNLPHLIIYLISYWWGLFDLHNLPNSFWIGGGILFATMITGVILKLQNKFVFFFFLWCLFTFSMSFGTKWNADVFRWLVFEGPISSSAGFIFRDGNKFAGLLSFGMSCLLGYGVAAILEEIHNLKKVREKLNQKAKWWLLNFNYFNIFIVAFGAGIIFCLQKYFAPVHDLYFDHLYRPTPIPDTYKEARVFMDETKDSEYSRTYMFPRYEMMVSPGYGYAVASWNAHEKENKPPKATSTIDIWSLGQRTYHPQEGSTVFWHTLAHYFFENLGHTSSQNIGRMFRALAMDRIVFHADIKGFEEMSEHAIDAMMKSDALKLIKGGDLGFFKIFRVQDENKWVHLYSRNLLSFSGFSVLDSIFNFPNYNEKETALFFGSQNSAGFNIKNLNPGDIIETKNELATILSLTDNKYLLAPFDQTLFGQPTYRWAKLRTDTPDWDWQLQSIGIKNKKHEFDGGKGIAYTMVSEMINLLPYEDFYSIGKRYNFTNFLGKDEAIFTSDIPEKLTIQEGFSNVYDDMPSVFGRVEQGQAKFFRIARSKKFPAKPNNGYFFEMVMSGRNAHLIHAKVKFFDAANEEVGIAYVSAPREVETFNFLKFKGLYVTPPETEKFQIEILSLENPKVKSFWYLHDFTILDLSPVMKANTLDFKFTPESSEPHLIFTRDFHNIKGGRISIAVEDNKPQIIATKTKFENKFIWKKIGKFNLTKNQPIDIQLRNIEGFNAANVIAVIPESEFNEYIRVFNRKTEETSQLVLLETDIEFEKLGHKQVDTNNPKYSNGRAIRLNSGFLRTNFSIIKNGRFKVQVRTEIMNDLKNIEKKEVTLTIQNSTGKTIYQEIIPLHKEKTLFDKKDKKREMWWVKLPDRFFEKGEYQLIIKFNDQSESLIKIDDFRPWKTAEFQFKTPPSVERNRECSKYIKTDQDTMSTFFIQGAMRVNITQGVSCDWQTLVSEPIRVKPAENYLLNFEVASQQSNKLHFKINYFDRHNRFIQTKQLAFPDKQSFPFFKIEELLEIPNGAVQMQLQLLARQNPVASGSFTIRHFTIKKFNDLPLVDLIAIFEKWSPKKDVPKVLDIKKNYLEYEITLSPNPNTQKHQNFTLQMGESFHVLWSMLDQELHKEITAKPVFMTLNSFQIPVGPERKTLVYQFRPQHAYYLGLSITGGALLLIIVWFWFVRPRSSKPKKPRKNKK